MSKAAVHVCGVCPAESSNLYPAARPAPVFIEPYTGGVACAALAAATEHCTRLMELDDQLCRFVERADCNVLHTIILRDFFLILMISKVSSAYRKLL